MNQNPSCLPTRSRQPASTLGEQRREKQRLLTRSLFRIGCSSSCRDLGACCWWRLVEILRRDCRSRAFVRDPWRSPPCSALCSALLASHSPCDPASGSSVAASLLLFASSTTLLPLSVKISSGSRRGSIIHTHVARQRRTTVN